MTQPPLGRMSTHRDAPLAKQRKKGWIMTGRGYIFAELKVTDEKHFYDVYMPRVTPVLEKYGAKFIVAGGNPRVIEGGREVKRIVLLEFESPERAEEFYYSNAYQAVIDDRFRSADTHLYFFDGSAPDSTSQL